MSENQIFKEVCAAMHISQMGLPFRQEALTAVFSGGTLESIFARWQAEKKRDNDPVEKHFSAEAEIEKAMNQRIELITISDPRYPPQLTRIDDAPLILYAKGKTEIMNQVGFAIVGARQASFYGEEQTRRFSRVLSDAGMTIVSGMARGIDEAAHESALRGEGNTVAVLGCGIDVIYPRENESLYYRIAEQGLILSEYPFESEPRAYHFPRRNRILSGLSWGVLVVEAHERSGSLITAYQALEQGRDVFALPGPVHHITSRGTHRLIREGATLVEAPEEILEMWPHDFQQAELLLKREQRIVERMSSNFFSTAPLDLENCHPILGALSSQSRDYEGLFELSGLSPHDFARAMTELEIEGKIRRNMAGYYETT